MEKQFAKQDLKYGNVIELEDGSRFIFTLKANKTGRYFIRLDRVINWGVEIRSEEDLQENFTFKCTGANTIKKIYEDYTCSKLLWKREEFKPYLDKNGQNYGLIGKKTNLTAIFGEKLYVGDVVEVYDTASSIGHKSIELVCEDESGGFVMGIACSSRGMKDGIARDWQVRKVKSYKELTNGYKLSQVKAVLSEV